MIVEAGSRLGPYEIVAPLGSGGMGEVWRARDTRLDRSVAIKVLPAAFSADAQLKSRFEREARAISALNHPHICTLHDVGCEGGVDYLVMELIDGESLADRLARGALPISEVLRYGIQIAGALDKAHRGGIVHRDLKPGNIMITKSGAKLLDFGLASVAPPPSAFEGATEHKPLTQEGTILGTFQYMAPEQLEGVEADPRTDIFAFGALLYEMATGRRAFTGKTKTSLIAAIVQSEPPPISAIQPLTPPALDHVVQKCLSKDREDRWQSAHDIAEELKWISEAGSQAGLAAPLTMRRKSRERIAWIVALVALLLALLGGREVLRMRKESPQVIQASLEAPAPETIDRTSPPAISPDGRSVAFCARARDGVRRLSVRSLEAATVKSYEGTGGATAPFWSADGGTIGFFADGKLRKIELNGGTAEDVSVATGIPGGACFAADGTIFFTTFGGQAGSQAIRRIDPAGSVPTAVTHPRANEWNAWPRLLPDGRHILFFAGSNPPQVTDGIAIASIDGGEVRRLMPSASQAVYVTPGYLLYRRGTALMARPFDPQKLAFSGIEHRVATDVGFTPISSAMLVDASAARLVYAAEAEVADAQLVIVDGSGKSVQIVGAPARYYSPRLSHDFTRVAVDMSDPVRDNGDIWIFDLKRGTSTRLTYDDANESGPIWRPDDSRVDFFRSVGGGNSFFELSSSGTGEEAAIPPRDTTAGSLMFDWSHDGRWLLYSRMAPLKPDIWLYDRTTERSSVWLKTPFAEVGARFSPDGHHVAYASDESGRFEIYVQSFPESSGKWLVSKGGGQQPVWSPDGHELFYVSADNKLTRVPVTMGSAGLDAGTPQPLFEVRLRDWGVLPQYGVLPGGRFLLNQISDEGTKSLQLVVNWTERLNK